MKTEEGKVKDKVKAFLHSRKVQSLTHPIPDAVGFYWMPVPSGRGASFLDFVICYRGRFVAVETKVADKAPTARQQFIIDMSNASGGFVVWGEDKFVTSYLTQLFDLIDEKLL